MPNARRFLLAALLLLAANRAVSDVGPSDFYRSAYHRGVDLYSRGEYGEAVKLLRVAAFGSLDDVSTYQRAYMYMALAADRLGHERDRAAALVRLATVDKLIPGHASLDLGPDQARFIDLLRHYRLSLSPVAAREQPAGPTPADPGPAATPARDSAARPATGPTTAPAPASASRPAPASASTPTRVSAATSPPASAPASPPASAAAPDPRPAAADPRRLKPESPESHGIEKNPAPATPAPAAPPQAQPAAPGPATGEASGEFTLQVAIACEQKTVENLRRRLPQVSIEPQTVGGRPCHRVTNGRYATREQALADREAVRQSARTGDLPVVIRATEPAPAPRPE